MQTPLIVTDPALIAEALTDQNLIPQPRPNPQDRSVLRLRDAMARFSSGDTHSARRAEVVHLLDGLASYPFAERARSEAVGVPADDIATVVPTRVLAAALGVGAEDLDQVVQDVRQIAAVIGRGDDATDHADDAANRLLARLNLAAVSVLYQNFDATAALYHSTSTAAASGNERASALVRTVRFAHAPTMIGDQAVEQGQLVELSLSSLALEFGSGPHHCPGRRIAERIVSGLIAT